MSSWQLGFSWRFGKYEHLAVIVALMNAKEVFITTEKFDHLMEDYDSGVIEYLYKVIQKRQRILKLFNDALEDIKNKKLECFDDLASITKAPAFARVCPLEFMGWAKDKNITIPYFLIEAEEKLYKEIEDEKIEREEQRIISSYKERSLKEEDVELLTREPLWYLSTAILYLHGFQSCGSEILDEKCVNQALDLKKIHSFALDAYNTNAFGMYSKQGYGEVSMVKPDDFIKWSRTLGRQFALYNMLGSKKENHFSVLSEKQYTTPYLELMLRAIDDLNISKENQPVKESIVDWFKEQDVNLSDREAEYMSTFVRLPNMKKGGRWRSDKALGDTQKTKIVSKK